MTVREQRRESQQVIAKVESVYWIPDMGLPSWCSSKEWLVSVRRDDKNGGIGRNKNKDKAIQQAFELSASFGQQEEIREPREQGQLW